MSRTWDLTVNNYDQSNIDWLKSISDEVSRIVVSKEVGETGTPHLQGRITFRRTYRLKSLKKLSGDKFHWEPTKCAQDNLYCMKQDSDVIIHKINTQQGQRRDLAHVSTKIDEGATMEDFMDDTETLNVMAKYGPFVSKLFAHKRRRTEFQKPNVMVYHGESGTGKTREAYKEAGSEVYVWEPANGKWFDGYHGQRTVIFEEFRGQLPFGTLLRLLDGYPHTKVEIKGGFVDWSPTKIILTSPKHPDDWYQVHGESLQQLRRRISLTKKF